MTFISPGGDTEEERVAIYRNVIAEKNSFIERLKKKVKRRLNLIGKYIASTINLDDFTLFVSRKKSTNRS